MPDPMTVDPSTALALTVIGGVALMHLSAWVLVGLGVEGRPRAPARPRPRCHVARSSAIVRSASSKAAPRRQAPIAARAVIRRRRGSAADEAAKRRRAQFRVVVGGRA